MSYILIKTKNGCFPIRHEFEKLKEAKSELFRIANYEGGCWFDKEGFEYKIIKKIIDGGKVDEAVVKDPDPVFSDCEEDDKIDPDALPFGETYVEDDLSSGKLPFPCNSCCFACEDPLCFNSASGVFCSYGQNSNDYLLRESDLLCKGDFKI